MRNCNPLTPDATKYLSHVPLANPFAFRWVLANNDGNRRGVAPRGDTLTYVKSPGAAGVDNGNGAVIHAGNERLETNPPFGKWHHVSIEVDGELLYDAGLDVLDAPQVQSNGQRSSLLKARITLDMGNSRQRKFDFDIAAGVELDVECYSVSNIKLLIPDPLQEIPNLGEIVVVPGTPTDPQQLSSVLTTAVHFTHRCPQGYRQPLTYTVPFIVGGGDNSIVFIPRMPDATDIQLVAGETANLVGGFVVEFLYIPHRVTAPAILGFREAAYDVTPPNGAPTEFWTLGRAVLGTNESVIPSTIIPGHCNAFRITRNFVGDFSFGSLIQLLNV